MNTNEKLPTNQPVSSQDITLDYIIGQIVHELRNPLTLLSTSMQIIEKEHPEALCFDYWQEMQEDLSQMARILADLAVYHQEVPLHLESVPLTDLVQGICSTFMPSLAETSIRMILDVPHDLPEITCDRGKIEQVMHNLLRNASDALSGHGRIAIHAWATARDVTIEIDDNGCGISPERQKVIFSPFITYKSSGTGLGLSIAKHLMEAHHGELLVCSDPKIGTCFIMRLPIHQP